MSGKSDSERAHEALRRCDPSCSRDVWVRIGMAFKSAVPDGFVEFEDWSSQGGNYKGTKDVLSAWRSFTDGRVGFGTLMHYAQEHSGPARRLSRTPVAAHVTARNERQAPDPSTLWEQCREARDQHPYILKKRGAAAGLREVPPDAVGALAQHRGSIVVPIRKVSGELQSLQFIPAEGPKRNLWGRPLEGCFTLGDVHSAALAYVVEGIGQAWTANRLTGAPVVVTLGFGRTSAVLEDFRTAHPAVSLCLVADAGKEGEAKKIATLMSCSVVTMPEGAALNTDINDVELQQGAGAAHALLRAATRPEEPLRFELLTADALRHRPGAPDRIRGVFPARGIAAVYGASGCGKSFLVLHMASAIVHGHEWFGRKVRAAPVIYLALEGQGGVTMRVRALEAQAGAAMPTDFRLVLQPFKLTKPEDVHDLAKAADRLGPSPVIFIDTLNRASPGADENSSQAMGLIIENAMMLAELTGGLVVLVHHTGKDASRGLRGHSSLIAALDAAIEVTREGENRSWSVAKNKDGADGVGGDFHLQVEHLGTDSEGDPVESCIVVPDNFRAEVRGARLPRGRHQQAAFDAIKSRLFVAARDQPGAATDEPCISMEEALACAKAAIKTDPYRASSRSKEAVTGLIEGGVLMLQEGMVWMP